ncbi:MAG: hypothetical protein JWN48_1954 [Myxococcaceae bacterium]|nr:hypothetical protein [Myxococcaceae bacterium]
MHRRTGIPSVASQVAVVVASLLAVLPVACSLETSGSGPGSGIEPDDDNPPDDLDQPDADPGVAPSKPDASVARDGAVLTPPTTTGSCTAGRYEGSYDCTYMQQGPFGLTSSTVSGAVTFSLTAKASGKDFTVSNGKFSANPAAFQTISGTMEGTLTCGRPFAGKIVKGTQSGLFQLGSTPFEATIMAAYDTKLTTFVQGTWSIPDDGAMSGCEGSWDAHYVGP